MNKHFKIVILSILVIITLILMTKCYTKTDTNAKPEETTLGEQAEESEMFGETVPDNVYECKLFFNSEAYDYFDQLPLETMSVLSENINKYIDTLTFEKEVGTNINSTGEMTLLEDTFELSKTKCEFTINLNNDYLLNVSINLDTQNFEMKEVLE